MSSAEAPAVLYQQERDRLIAEGLNRNLAFDESDSNDDIKEALEHFDREASRLRQEGFEQPKQQETPSPYKRDKNRLVYEMRFTEEDVKVEPFLRLTIAAENGSERVVELKAVDVAGLTHVVTQLDKIDFEKDQDKFYDAMCRRLARLMGEKKVSQKFLNQVVDAANAMLVPQKKTDSDSSES